MGTDVDFWIERRVADGWAWVEPPEETFFATYGRPYRLFSLLLGRPVGLFSGAQELPRIAPGRGFPTDLSPKAERELAEWRESWERDPYLPDGVTPEDICRPSWVMAEEVLSYDWDQDVRQTAWAFTAQVGDHRGADGAVDLCGRPCAQVAFGREEDAARLDTDAPWVLFNSFVIHGRPNRPDDSVPEWVTQVYQWSSVREYIGCVEEFLDGVRALGPPSEIRLTYLADQ